MNATKSEKLLTFNISNMEVLEVETPFWKLTEGKCVNISLFFCRTTQNNVLAQITRVSDGIMAVG